MPRDDVQLGGSTRAGELHPRRHATVVAAPLPRRRRSARPGDADLGDTGGQATSRRPSTDRSRGRASTAGRLRALRAPARGLRVRRSVDDGAVAAVGWAHRVPGRSALTWSTSSIAPDADPVPAVLGAWRAAAPDGGAGERAACRDRTRSCSGPAGARGPDRRPRPVVRERPGPRRPGPAAAEPELPLADGDGRGLLDRHADEAAPLGPAAVVVADALVAEQLVEHEPGVAASARRSGSRR